jgi:predicted nucleic acid-binding protein
MGWATRTPEEFDGVRADRAAGYEWLAIHDEDGHRALQIQAALRHAGRIRAVGIPDLLIAAVAERERVTIVHYDGDYELIATVTGQPVVSVVPRGSVA